MRMQQKSQFVKRLVTSMVLLGAVSVNAMADSCIWYADDDTIRQVQTSTNQITHVIPLRNPQRLIMNATDCGVWVLDKNNSKLLRYSADGVLEREIRVRNLDARLDEVDLLHVDPYDGSLWITDDRRIDHVTPTGQLITSFSAPGDVRRMQVALDRSLWALGKRDLWHFDPSGKLLTKLPARTSPCRRRPLFRVGQSGRPNLARRRQRPRTTEAGEPG